MTSALQVLANTQERLSMAIDGLRDVQSPNPGRRRAGFMNVAVYGRAVTQALQRLRGVVPEFAAWYNPRIEKLGNDPLFRYFNQLRNSILKRGELDTAGFGVIDRMDQSIMEKLNAKRPPGAKRFFMIDALGGSGWEVEMPDGTTARYYVDIPSVHGGLMLPDAPTEHLGAPIPDTSALTLARLYIKTLTDLVNEAIGRFGS